MLNLKIVLSLVVVIVLSSCGGSSSDASNANLRTFFPTNATNL